MPHSSLTMFPKNKQTLFSIFRGRAIAQLVEHWSRNPAHPVSKPRNLHFGTALILITRSLGEDIKPSVLWLRTNKHLCFLSSQVKQPPSHPLSGSCDFDTDYCTWMNAVSGDDSDWVRVNGAAVGGGTGPTKDHTTGAMLGKKGFHEITPDPAL